LRLLLADGTSALVVDPARGCQVCSGERVMALLHRFVESTWRDAVPLDRALARSQNT
jgi:hypothetical protein